MGGEGAVQVLEQLVHGVVVGVAQHPAVEHVGPGEEAPGAQIVVGVLDLLHRPVYVVHHHRPRGDDPPARHLPHLLAPAVVGPAHGGLEFGVHAVGPEVVPGAVDHHEVHAVQRHGLGHGVAGEAVVHHSLAVFFPHYVVGPVHRFHEVAVDGDPTLGIAAVHGGRAERLPAGDFLPAHPVLELLVQEPLPQVLGLHHVPVGVEDLVPMPHVRLSSIAAECQLVRQE